MVRRIYESVGEHTKALIRNACDKINDYMIGDFVTKDDIASSRNRDVAQAYRTLFNYFTKLDRKTGFILLDAASIIRDLGAEGYENIDNYKYALHTLLSELCGYDEYEAYRMLDL